MRKYLALFSFCLLGISCSKTEKMDITVIPEPQVIEVKDKVSTFDIHSTFSSNLPEKDLKDLSAYVAASPLQLKVSESNTAPFRFELVESIDGISSPEGYTLTIDQSGVKSTATTAAGLFYAYQTLLQMAEFTADNSYRLPQVQITDYPRLDYRGLHLDVSRHFYDKEFVKKQLDAMARYKLNRFHWHLTDGAGWRIEIKKYPELTENAAFRPYQNWQEWWKGDRKYSNKHDKEAHGGYYTQEDIREVLEYARQLHITVIPEIEMPGHSEEVLAVYPQLSCAGKPYHGGEFCVGNEETFTFLQNVLLEVIDLFPSEYIHIGGDEAAKNNWKKCPKCQARIRKEGLKNEEELQSYLIHRIERFLNEHGRKLLGWDEILEGGLAPGATVMSWRGEEGGITAAKAGHDVIMTPGAYCYLDSYQDAPSTQPLAIGGFLTLEKVYSYNPVPEQLDDSQKGFIKGVQGNVWTEYMPTPEHTEYMIYPRLLAIAEVGWTLPEHKNWELFHTKALEEVAWLQEKGYHPFDLSKEVGEREVAKKPVEHLALHKKVIYNNPYSNHYTAGGDSALVDGIRGGWTYLDKRWQGFIGKDLDVTVDLGTATKFKSIATEFMQLTGPYVWLPKEVTFSISADGKEFTELYKETTQVPTTVETLTFHTYEWKGESEAQFVRVQASLNEIAGGWLFLDEIVITD